MPGVTELWAEKSGLSPFVVSVFIIEKNKFIHSVLVQPNTKYQELQWRNIGYFNDDWRYPWEGEAKAQKLELLDGV